MNTRRFRAKTVKEALRKVRDALGPDAVILHQGQADGLIEILASAEFPELSEPDPVPVAPAPPLVPAVHAVQIETRAPEPTRSPITRYELALVAAGFDDAAILRTLEPHDAPLRDRTGLLARLASRLPVAPRAVDAAEARIRLVGPPGAGKTSTLIKVAAGHALKHGAADVAIITQDCGRLAGSEQLLLASELLGIPVREAIQPLELRRALAEFASKRCVLLDTPGFVGKSTGELRALPGFDTLLVLPATYQRAVLARILESVPALGVSGVVLTHADGALGLGEPLSACWAVGVPIVWIGTGNVLPDGIEAATGELLATLAFAGIVLDATAPDTRANDDEQARAAEANARAPRRTIAIV